MLVTPPGQLVCHGYSRPRKRKRWFRRNSAGPPSGSLAWLPAALEFPGDRSLPLGWWLEHVVSTVAQLVFSRCMRLHPRDRPPWRLKILLCRHLMFFWPGEAGCLLFPVAYGVQPPVTPSKHTWLTPTQCSRRKGFKNTLSMLMHSGSRRWLAGRQCQVWHSHI